MSRVSAKLLAKYRAVIDEWFSNKFNGSAAWKKYYPKVTKDETAATNFSRIKRLPEIEKYIAEKKAAAAEAANISHKELLLELLKWLRADITQTIGLTPEQIRELPEEIRLLITKYKYRAIDNYNSEGTLINTVTTIEVHFPSKERAAEMISKHIGFYEADNEQKQTDIKIVTANEKHLAIVQKLIEG